MTLNGVMAAEGRYVCGGYARRFQWLYQKHSDYTNSNSPNRTAHCVRVKHLNEALV